MCIEVEEDIGPYNFDIQPRKLIDHLIPQLRYSTFQTVIVGPNEKRHKILYELKPNFVILQLDLVLVQAVT